MEHKYKLDPCPFCGAEIYSDCLEEVTPGRWSVVCPECEAGGPIVFNKQKAIDKWNKVEEEEE